MASHQAHPAGMRVLALAGGALVLCVTLVIVFQRGGGAADKPDAPPPDAKSPGTPPPGMKWIPVSIPRSRR